VGMGWAREGRGREGEGGRGGEYRHFFLYTLSTDDSYKISLTEETFALTIPSRRRQRIEGRKQDAPDPAPNTTQYSEHGPTDPGQCLLMRDAMFRSE